MGRYAFGLLLLAAIALAGCAASTQPHSTCEVRVAQVCSGAVEAQLQNGTLPVSYSSEHREARVVPLVVPVLRQDGALAAEVDCYANLDSRTYSVVQSTLAIPPESQESVDFLRSRHLCADDGSYAQTGDPVTVASALTQSAR